METELQLDAPPQAVTLTCEPTHLSLVIPAYNEEARLGPTLEATIDFLSEKPYRSEALVVLDGCTDGTAAIARRHEGLHGNCVVRVIENGENRGKGACVRDGMRTATGEFLFFTDADLSYPLHQLDTFLEALRVDGGVAIASRDTSSVRYQAPLRRVITYVSRMVMNHLFVPGIRDTQAGFKGFTRDVALDLFEVQRLTRFGFDAEILHVAHARGYTIQALPVEWVDMPGSKVRPARDITRMAIDLLAIVVNRGLGRYRRRAV